MAARAVEQAKAMARMATAGVMPSRMVACMASGMVAGTPGPGVFGKKRPDPQCLALPIPSPVVRTAEDAPPYPV